MAQLIKKYSNGQPIQQNTITDEAPMQIGENFYDMEVFRRQALGPRVDKFIQAYDLSPEEASQFRKDLKAHIDEITQGSMYFTDNSTLENTTGEWSNDGVFKKKKLFRKLSPEDLKNNRSLYVTNYLVGSMNAGVFDQYQAPEQYKFNFDEAFERERHPGIPFDVFAEAWDNLDPIPTKKDKKGNETKEERGVKNRLNSIAEILEKEADKIDNDVRYRRSFSWEGWQDNWEGRHLSTSAKLREAAKAIKDNKYTPQDAALLYGLGINIDKYLYPEKRVKATQQAQATASEQQAVTGETGTGTGTGETGTEGAEGAVGVSSGQLSDAALAGSGSVGFITNLQPFESAPFRFNYNGKVYTGNEILDLEKIPELSEYFTNFNYSTTGIPSDLVKKGYNYAVNYTDVANLAPINDNKTLTKRPVYIYYKNKYDQTGAKTYVQWGADLVEASGIKKVNNGWEVIIRDPKDKKIYRIQPSTSTKPSTKIGSVPKSIVEKTCKYTSPSNFANDLWSFSTEDLKNINYYSDALYAYIQYLLQQEKKDGKNYVTREGNKYSISFGNGRTLIVTTNEGGLRKQNGLNIKSVRKKVISNKQGGVLKAQQGYVLETSAPTKVVKKNPRIHSSTGGRTNAAIGYEAREKQKEVYEITNTDLFRLGNSLVDLSSVVAAFVPGLHIASTATGMVSSFGEFGADVVDYLNGREGVEFWDSVKRLGLNLGMDLISLAPALKSVKGASALRKVAKYVPHIAGAIQTYNLISDPELRSSIGQTLNKVKDLDIENLNTQDFRNIAYLGRTLLAAKGVAGSVRSGKQKTGNVTVKGKVKVGNEYKTVEATVPKETIPVGKGRNTAAKEALAAKATEMYGKQGDTEVKFEPKDITVNKEYLGTRAKTDTEYEVKVSTSGPKKVFEGWFGSEGINWKFSDYNLSRTSPLVARLYGNEDRAQAIERKNNIDRYANARKNRPSDNKPSNNKKADKKTDNKPEKQEEPQPIRQEESQEPKVSYTLSKYVKPRESIYSPKVPLVYAGPNKPIVPKITNITPQRPNSNVDARVRRTAEVYGKRMDKPVNVAKVRRLAKSHTWLARAIRGKTDSQIREMFHSQHEFNIMLQNKTISTKGYTRGQKKKMQEEQSTPEELRTSKRNEFRQKIGDRKAQLEKKQQQENARREKIQEQQEHQMMVDGAKQQLALKIGAEKWNTMSPSERTAFLRHHGVSDKRDAYAILGQQNIPSGRGAKKLLEGMFKKYGIESPYTPSKPKKVAKKLFGGTLSPYLVSKLHDGGTSPQFVTIDEIEFPLYDTFFKKNEDGTYSLNFYDKTNNQSGYDTNTGIWYKYSKDNNNWEQFAFDHINKKFVPHSGDNKLYNFVGIGNTGIKSYQPIDNYAYYNYYGIDPSYILKESKGANGSIGNASNHLDREKSLYDENNKLKDNYSITHGINRVNDYYTSKKLHEDAANYIYAQDDDDLNKRIESYNKQIRYLNDTRKKEFADATYNRNTGGDYNRAHYSVYANYPGGYDQNLEDITGTNWYSRLVFKSDNDDRTNQDRIFTLNFGGKKAQVFIKSDGQLELLNPFDGDNTLSDEDKKKKFTEWTSKFFNTKKDRGINFNDEELLAWTALGTASVGNLLSTNKALEAVNTKKIVIDETPEYQIGDYQSEISPIKEKGKALTNYINSSSDSRVNDDLRSRLTLAYDEPIDKAKEANQKAYRDSLVSVLDNYDKFRKLRIQAIDTNNASDVAAVNYRKNLESNLISRLFQDPKTRVDEARLNSTKNRITTSKIRTESEIKRLQDAMQQELSAELIKKYGPTALAWYKSAYKDDDATISQGVVEAYLAQFPQKQEEALKIRNRIHNKYQTQQSEYLANNLVIPTSPFNYYSYNYTMDPTNYEWVREYEQYKKGGSLTASDKKKLQKLKDYNKKLETVHKEAMKTIRKDMKEYGKQSRTNAAGALHLLKQMTK